VNGYLVNRAQLPWLDVLDDDDGVAAVADELLELELLELVELLEVVDELPVLEVPAVDVPVDFVDDDPVLVPVVLDAVALPVAVVAAMTPVSASIPATLAAPTARRVRRAGWGRRRLRDRTGGAAPRAGISPGRGSVSFGMGTPVGARTRTFGRGLSFWFR